MKDARRHLVAVTEWGVSLETALNMWRHSGAKVILHVNRVVRNEDGKLISISHPEHDGKEFIGFEAADDYAIAHGLLRYADEVERSPQEINDLMMGIDFFGDLEREEKATKKVLAELQKEDRNLNFIGENFPMDSLDEYTNEAKRWLHGNSKLSSRVIDAADYSMLYEYFLAQHD